MKDRRALITRALKNLGALPQGQAPSDEEYDSMDALIDSMIAELEARNVVYVQDADQIPDEYFQPLGHILASAARAEFGAADDVAIVALAQRAEMDLRIMTAEGPTYEPLKAEYF